MAACEARDCQICRSLGMFDVSMSMSVPCHHNYKISDSLNVPWSGENHLGVELTCGSINLVMALHFCGSTAVSCGAGASPTRDGFGLARYQII